MEFWVHGQVMNKAVKAWRTANPDLSLRNDDVVFGGLAGNVLGTYQAGEFRLMPGDPNGSEVKRLADFLTGVVVPWLELAHDPDDFITRAPDISLDDPSAAEWLLSVERRDLVERLIRRVAARSKSQSAFESGRRKALHGSDRVFTGPGEQWGWLAVVNGFDIW